MLCDRKILIEDTYGTASSIIMSVIRDYAIDKNIEIITVKNNILPHEQIEHILIPSLSLAFISGKNFDAQERVIHSSRFMDRNILKEHRSALKLIDKLSNEFTLSAVEILKKAKENHDKLEEFYIKSMDFEAMERLICVLYEKLFIC